MRTKLHDFNPLLPKNSPEDVTIAFGVSVTEAQFDAARRTGNPDSIECSTSRSVYIDQVVRPYEICADRFRVVGSRVLEQVTDPAELASCYQPERSKVVVLFSHWTETGAIQLGDRYWNPEAVIAAFPLQTIGNLDLAICSPAPLVNAAGVQRPFLSITGGSDRELHVMGAWMFYYLAVVRALQMEAMPYVIARLRVAKAFLDLTHD